jgi:prepilin-type N-terminal cleavage/methylation domain-containing protein
MSRLNKPTVTGPKGIGIFTGWQPALPVNQKQGSAAFTLVELLAVVAILGILAALLVPFLGGMREKARSAACLGNLRSIGAALTLQVGENGGFMPDIPAARQSINDPEPGIDTLLADYVDAPRVFACPSDQELARQTGTSYFYNSALRGQPLAALNFLGLTDKHSRIPVMVDKEGWHRGGSSRVNHLFADGSVNEQLRLFAE